MSNYIFSNGQFYEVTDDELSHAWLKKGEQKKDHKYIKREWKNGKWRYYYDYDELRDALGYDELANMEKARHNYINKKYSAESSSKFFNKHYSKIDYTDGKYMKERDKAATEYYRRVEARDIAASEYIAARKEFLKTPLGVVTASKEIITAGVNYLKNRLDIR